MGGCGCECACARWFTWSVTWSRGGELGFGVEWSWLTEGEWEMTGVPRGWRPVPGLLVPYEVVVGAGGLGLSSECEEVLG